MMLSSSQPLLESSKSNSCRESGAGIGNSAGGGGDGTDVVGSAGNGDMLNNVSADDVGSAGNVCGGGAGTDGNGDSAGGDGAGTDDVGSAGNGDIAGGGGAFRLWLSFRFEWPVRRQCAANAPFVLKDVLHIVQYALQNLACLANMCSSSNSLPQYWQFWGLLCFVFVCKFIWSVPPIYLLIYLINLLKKTGEKLLVIHF